MTSEMLSGLVADMTASVSVDGAIGLPSPTAGCSFPPSSIVSRNFVLNNICIRQHRFYSLLGSYPSNKFEWIFLPLAAQFKMPLAEHESGKISEDEVVLTSTRDVAYIYISIKLCLRNIIK